MHSSRVVRRSILSAPALAILAACGLSEPVEDGEPRAVAVRTLWRQPHVGYARAQPAVLGGLVYTATGDGRVVARDLGSGAARWTAVVGQGPVDGANLAARAGVVVAPVLYHTVGLDAATGAQLWRYLAPLDTVGGGPPNPGTVVKVRIEADDEAAYIAAWGPSLAAVELRTGRVRWQWTPPPGTPFRFGAQGVALEKGEVFLAVDHALDERGSRCELWVAALEAATGREMWVAKLPYQGTVSCAAGRPAVTSDRVIAMHISGEIFGLDRATGQVVWNVPRDTAAYLAVLSSPTVYDGVVYAPSGSDHLRALSARDGRPLWRTSVRAQHTSDLLVTDKHIYGVDGPYLFIFNRRTGALLGRTEQPDPPRLGGLFPGTPAYADGRVIVPVAGGVWAFQEP